MNQQELELQMYAHGRERIRDSIQKNEDAGHAESNPYAHKLYKEFLFPLRDVLTAEMSAKKAGRRQAHTALLAGMDPSVLAYLAIRHSMGSALSNSRARLVALDVGRAVYHEHLLEQFADASPALFHTLLHDIDRRMSTDERYKIRVMRNQATKNGVEFQEWGNAALHQVGYYLLDKMVQIGLFEEHRSRDGINEVVDIALSPKAEFFVKQISDFVVENAPYWTPCIEPPRDWVSPVDGGYHTQEMRRLAPYLVNTHNTARRFLTDEACDLSREMKCVNALQRTAWRVNSDLLDIATNVSYHYDMEEILMQGEVPKPRKPEWLQDQKVESLEGAQLAEFKMWKREVANWHTDERARRIKGYRFTSTMRSARQFVDQPAIYFVYFMDFRYRKYVRTNGISPQGSDLQKALLEFSAGKPLHTQSAKDWFVITGANRFGVDKVTYEDRIQWVKDNEHLILDWARNPIDSPGWMEADKPFQFLAWCLEYAKWKVHGDKFLSRLSVGMDGSCNGLQNFSAMLRDPVGGAAVNLLPSKLPSDIYAMVARRTTELLLAEDEDEDGFRTLWLEHVLTRGLVKRSVMTLPYGSKRQSCRDFIVADYLKAGKFPELDPKRYAAAANYLSYRVWAAIGDVVVKAREAMDWLQDAARTIVKTGDECIRWITPTGAPVVQVYYGSEVHRINTKLCGNLKIRVLSETSDVDLLRSKNGIAPNFVHSMDAAHLTLTCNAAADAGITAFHMVHDDYGTHAADAGELYRLIREEFVGMYQRHDMLQELRDAYPVLPEPPEQGTLDLMQVIDSPYFFG